VTRSLNRPEREWLPYFDAGISIVKKVKLIVVARARERFAFSEVEPIRICLNRSINQQFGVYSQFATMSHGKATVTHRRKGR
jgi:hypothetical protein